MRFNPTALAAFVISVVLLSSSLRASEVPLGINGGVYTVPMQINRSINLEFLVDPGAAIVVIPVAIFRSLVSNGTLTQSDILGIRDRKSSLLNSSHVSISYAVFCLKKKK